MTSEAFRGWQAVQDEVLRRIRSRQWMPGEIIPNEEDLASEFGCARATVNRALRNLAEAGLLDRKRKAGTRVALHPVRKATLDIPVIRLEIEARASAYGYELLKQEDIAPPPQLAAKLGFASAMSMLRVLALHSADDRPYVLEDRWINRSAVPGVDVADFSVESPNEWLVVNVPFEGGDIAFSAIAAGTREAGYLRCAPGDGLFVIDRTTWSARGLITQVRLTFAPGYRMHTVL